MQLQGSRSKSLIPAAVTVRIFCCLGALKNADVQLPSIISKSHPINACHSPTECSVLLPGWNQKAPVDTREPFGKKWSSIPSPGFRPARKCPYEKHERQEWSLVTSDATEGFQALASSNRSYWNQTDY